MLRINTQTCRSHVYIVKPGVSQSGETQDATCLVERVKNALLVFRALRRIITSSVWPSAMFVFGFLGFFLCWNGVCECMGKGPFRLNRYTQHCIASSHSTASRVHTALHREATCSFEHRSVCRKTNMQVVLIGIRRRALG